MTCAAGAIPDPPASLSVTLLGGLTLEASPSTGAGVVGSELAAAMSMLGQLGPALGAMAPVLKVIDAVTSLFGVLQRAPEIPVDPSGFVEALEEAAQKVAALAPLIPQVSVPAMIGGAITAVAAHVRAVAAQVASIADVEANAQALLDAATGAGDAALEAQAQCALDNAATLTRHAEAAMGPAGSILDVLSSLMAFIPAPVELPGLPQPGGAASDLAAALGTLASTLEAIQIPGA